MCGGLFVLAGTALLAVNYLLVRSHLASVSTGAVNSGSSQPASLSQTIPHESDLIKYRSDVLHTLLGQSVIALAVTLAFVILAGWLVAKRMLRPVHLIATTVRNLGADSLTDRVAMEGPRDELTDLADTFDDMLERLAVSFDSQRRFVANASHELRTPLAAQRTLLEVGMQRANLDPDSRQMCDRLLTMNVRIEALIEGLLVLARSDRGLDVKTPVHLDRVAESVLAAHEVAAGDADVRLHREIIPHSVSGDQVLLERLVNNLIDNAIKYNQRGGEIWVRIGGVPAVTVTNTGYGIPGDQIGMLFEPFRRMRQGRDRSTQGAGLGLSIVASIARAHGGKVTAKPHDGGGLTIEVWLP